MSDNESDPFDDDFSKKRLFQEFEQAIREINRAAISAVTGSVTKDRFLRVAGVVSRLRARYLGEVLKLADGPDKALDPTAILDLRHMREAYEEAVQGFGALRHAVERGYVELPKR